jgi:hypothetical protein
MLSSQEKLARLRQLYEVSRESEEFEGGVSVHEEVEALVVGDWGLLAYDDEDNLALSFHINAHPVAVARLTRFLVEHDVPFVLYEAFTINDADEIVFESNFPPEGPPA